MRLIVISRSKNSLEDGKIIKDLMENGVERFHLRKPSMSTTDMRSLLEVIPESFRDRIVIHSHHKLATEYNLGGIHLTGIHRKRKFSTWWRIRRLRIAIVNPIISTSFQKLGHVYSSEKVYTYAFLGAVFDRLTGNFSTGYNAHSVAAAIKKSKSPLIARGGITYEHIPKCIELGFAGAAFASSIWDQPNPVDAWIRTLDFCKAEGIKVSG
ncbi:MAG: thiamine phosphate synthase [Bacteroidia bacterium]|nr:thiamine phosphate synthase [Bacteroidia bacterium]